MLIAGGGPVGLTLALELEHHGVEALLIERNPTTTDDPAPEDGHHERGTMELFRRLRVAALVRKAAVPAYHRMPSVG